MCVLKVFKEGANRKGGAEGGGQENLCPSAPLTYLYLHRSRTFKCCGLYIGYKDSQLCGASHAAWRLHRRRERKHGVDPAGVIEERAASSSPTHTPTIHRRAVPFYANVGDGQHYKVARLSLTSPFLTVRLSTERNGRVSGCLRNGPCVGI